MRKSKSFGILPYQKTTVNDLIIFCIYSVHGGGNREKCSFERLVGECFKLFPEHFAFTKYPQWPDARKLDRPLRMLRDRKLITGDPQSYFNLTKIGKKVAEDIVKNFRQRKLFK